jgi:hypothetical protein
MITLRGRNNLHTALEKLSDIMVQHMDHQDDLSKKLFKWGSKILSIDYDNISDGSLRDQANREITKLILKLLVEPTWEEMRNPPKCAPIENSSRGFIVSRTASDLYHPFAREMMQWILSLYDSQHCVLVSANSPQEEMGIVFQALYQRAMKYHRLKEETRLIRQVQAQFELQVQVSEEQTRLNVAKYQAQTQALLNQFEQGIQTVNARHEEDRKAMEDRLEQQQKGYQAQVAAQEQSIGLLQRHLTDAIHRGNATAHNLQQVNQTCQNQQVQIQQLQQQLQAQAADIKRLEKKGSGGCAIM